MPKLNWDADDFKNPQDSSGTTTEQISGGGLQQGYFHGSLTEGLVAYYPMDSGEGSTLKDETELGNDGTLKPGTLGTTTTTGMWSSNSKIGSNCLEFDGQDDYIDIKNQSNFRLSTFSISVWVKTNKNDSSAIFYRGDSSEYEYLLYNTGGDDSIRVYVTDSSSSNYNANVPNATDGKWHHIVGLWDGSQLKIFMDGSLQDTVNVGDISIYSSSGKVNIGYYNEGNNYFEGAIDDVRIYDRPLSTPEIKALYNLNRPSKVSAQDTLQ